MTALSVNESGNELRALFQRLPAQLAPSDASRLCLNHGGFCVYDLFGLRVNAEHGSERPYDGVGASRRLDCAGNWVNAQDSVDSRIVNAVANGTTLYGSYDYSSLSASPQSQANLGGWPTMAAGTPCTDSDHDGIPDTWRWRMA